ncbi:potassium channel family protein [Aquipuribacter sp. MA13-6]|uniref:potassium channel family protein n=1 Tax=unclassified Aquipuribacter TaxID=2635084 RepID=UPI003EEAC41E
MHFVVMGCGRVGARLAHDVEEQGHSVAVIDSNPDSFRRLGPDFSGRTVAGIGFDRDTLLRAGIEEAYAFAAVSSGDNSNIISARVARETYSVARVVARIYDPGRAEVYRRLGIATVATVPWTSREMIAELLPTDSVPLWTDEGTRVAMVELSPHAGWLGRPVRELEEAADVRVAYLTRLGHPVIPRTDTVLQDGDRVFVVVEHSRRRAAVDAAAAAVERG